MPNADKNAEKLDTLLVGLENSPTRLWKTVCQFLKKWNMLKPHNLANATLRHSFQINEGLCSH